MGSGMAQQEMNHPSQLDLSPLSFTSGVVCKIDLLFHTGVKYKHFQRDEEISNEKLAVHERMVLQFSFCCWLNLAKLLAWPQCCSCLWLLLVMSRWCILPHCRQGLLKWLRNFAELFSCRPIWYLLSKTLMSYEYCRLIAKYSDVSASFIQRFSFFPFYVYQWLPVKSESLIFPSYKTCRKTKLNAREHVDLSQLFSSLRIIFWWTLHVSALSIFHLEPGCSHCCRLYLPIKSCCCCSV